MTNRSNILLGRWAGLPYELAEMVIDEVPVDAPDGEHDQVVRYRGQRRGSSAGYDLTLRVGAAIEQSPLDVFLTGRWSAYSRLGRRLVRFDVHHEPWPLQHAAVESMTETILAAAGIPHPTNSPRTHFATAVHAALAPARLII